MFHVEHCTYTRWSRLRTNHGHRRRSENRPICLEVVILSAPRARTSRRRPARVDGERQSRKRGLPQASHPALLRCLPFLPRTPTSSRFASTPTRRKRQTKSRRKLRHGFLALSFFEKTALRFGVLYTVGLADIPTRFTSCHRISPRRYCQMPFSRQNIVNCRYGKCSKKQ